MLQEIAYAQTEEQYEELYDRFVRDAPESVCIFACLIYPVLSETLTGCDILQPELA
jgi:hypothetical protein